MLSTDVCSERNIFYELTSVSENHPIWQSALMQGLDNGAFTRDKLSFLFQQHYHYSYNFTKLLSLAMSRMNDPRHRAIVTENLYEEAGEENIEERHSELMLRFLAFMNVRVTPESIQPFTALYVERCIEFLGRCDEIEAGAFLAWGTEGIVPRLYGHFINGLDAIGMPPEHYRYFSLHIECDDGHHEALASIVLDIYNQAESDEQKDLLFQKVSNAITKSLDMRLEYFDQIVEHFSQMAISDTLAELTMKRPLDGLTLTQNVNEGGTLLYQNKSTESNLSFDVQRTKFAPDVLDPRLLTIAAGGRSESHKHAHESFFYVLSGEGKIHVDDQVVDIETGSMAYVPRWSVHHTENTGLAKLRILAITDFGLTRRVDTNTEDSYREKPANLNEEAFV